MSMLGFLKTIGPMFESLMIGTQESLDADLGVQMAPEVPEVAMHAGCQEAYCKLRHEARIRLPVCKRLFRYDIRLP